MSIARYCSASSARSGWPPAYPTTASAQQDFKIGVVESLTGGFVGPARDTMDGVEAWVKVRGLPGKKIVLTTLDDETNPVSAANAFRRLAGDPDIRLIYLFIPSSSALAVKTLASEFKVPIISGGAADALGTPADPYLFKVAPATRDFMTRARAVRAEEGLQERRAAQHDRCVRPERNRQHQETRPGIRHRNRRRRNDGVEDTNVNAQLTKIRAANPDMIYDGAASRAAILSFKQIKQLGLTMPLIVTQAVISKAVLRRNRRRRRSRRPDCPDPARLVRHRGRRRHCQALCRTREGDRPQAVYYDTFGFDVGLITEAAVKNSDGTRQGIRDALEKLKGLPALNGPITYSPEDHTGQNFKSDRHRPAGEQALPGAGAELARAPDVRDDGLVMRSSSSCSCPG